MSCVMFLRIFALRHILQHLPDGEAQLLEKLLLSRLKIEYAKLQDEVYMCAKLRLMANELQESFDNLEECFKKSKLLSAGNS